LIAGGLDSTSSFVVQKTFSIYSPGGGCSYTLAPLPVALNGVVLVQLMSHIYVCSGLNFHTNYINKECWKYDIGTNQWLPRASSNNFHAINLGIVYKNKLHMLDDVMGNSEVYDPVNDSWSSWNTSSLRTIGIAACHVQWDDIVIIFGGTGIGSSGGNTIVQIYNFTTNQWRDLSPMAVPHFLFGCIILPQNPNLVLLLSTTDEGDKRRADIYDIANNTWRRAGSSNNLHNGVQLISIGQRVFAIGGIPNGNVVEEYNYENDSWSKVEALLSGNGIIYSSVLSVPAALFNFLSYGCVGL
jgi:hypothetical protein